LHAKSSPSTNGICPISAAAPLNPLIGFPSIIRPPPTPVPIVTIIMLEYSLPLPFQYSPSAATLASLPAFIFSFGNIRSSDSFFGTFTTSHPRLTHLLTVPSSLTAPGTPIPIPAISVNFFLCIASVIFIYSAISGKMFSPEFSFLVGSSSFSISSPSSEKKPHLIVVPPTSMPNTTLFIIVVSPHEILLNSSVQFLSCIVTHLLLSVIYSCCFNNNCKITSRTDWK